MQARMIEAGMDEEVSRTKLAGAQCVPLLHSHKGAPTSFRLCATILQRKAFGTPSPGEHERTPQHPLVHKHLAWLRQGDGGLRSK